MKQKCSSFHSLPTFIAEKSIENLLNEPMSLKCWHTSKTRTVAKCLFKFTYMIYVILVRLLGTNQVIMMKVIELLSKRNIQPINNKTSENNKNSTTAFRIYINDYFSFFFLSCSPNTRLERLKVEGY